MTIPTTMADLYVARDSNSPAGSEPVFPNNDEFLRITQAILRRTNAKGTNLASAPTVNIGASTDGDFVDITGVATITAFDTVAAGIERVVRFTGILTLTHNGTSLILPNAVNIVTEVNDVAAFRSLGSGNWICTGFSRAAGYAKLSGATFTGDVVLAADPDNALEASTKQFVDTIVFTTGTATALVATRPNFKIHLAGVTGAAVTINTIALKFTTGEVVRDIHLLANDIISVAYDGLSAYWLNPPNRPIDFSSYAGSPYQLRVGESVKYSIASGSSKSLQLSFSELQSYKISGFAKVNSAADRLFVFAKNGSLVASDFSTSYNNAAGTASSAMVATSTLRSLKFSGDLFTGSATLTTFGYTGNSLGDNGTNIFGTDVGSQNTVAYTAMTSLAFGILDSINATSFSGTVNFSACDLLITRTA
jgi:hypothetical protein